MSFDLAILFAVVIAIVVVSSALSDYIRLPEAVFLPLVGIALKYAVPLGDSENLRSIMSSLGYPALAVILFQMGLELDFRRLRHQAGRGFLLALFSFVTGTFLLYCAFSVGLDFSGPGAWALAAALAGMSSNVVIPYLLKANPGQNLSNLLTTESAFSIIFSAIGALLLANSAGADSLGEIVWADKLLSLLLGGCAALILGLAWLWLLPYLAKRRVSYLLTLVVVFLLMGVFNHFGGSGAFAVLVFALILGNGTAIMDSFPEAVKEHFYRLPEGGGAVLSSMSDFHSWVLFFMRGLYFLYLGILFEWPGADLRIWLGIVTAGFAVVLGRDIAVQLSGWIGRIPGHDRALLRLGTARGLASAVLIAILAPWLGSGSWQTIALAVILVSNIRTALGVTKFSKKPQLNISAVQAGAPSSELSDRKEEQ